MFPCIVVVNPTISYTTHDAHPRRHHFSEQCVVRRCLQYYCRCWCKQKPVIHIHICASVTSTASTRSGCSIRQYRHYKIVTACLVQTQPMMRGRVPEQLQQLMRMSHLSPSTGTNTTSLSPVDTDVLAAVPGTHADVDVIARIPGQTRFFLQQSPDEILPDRMETKPAENKIAAEIAGACVCLLVKGTWARRRYPWARTETEDT